MTNDGQRLYLRQINLVESQDAEHLRQRTLLMREREDETRLVGLLKRTQEVGLHRIGRHEEAGEVVLVVLDIVLEHLQAV